MLGAAEALTVRQGEDHVSATHRALKNALAVKVKRADIRDNLDQSRMVSAEDEERINGYRESLALIDGRK